VHLNHSDVRRAPYTYRLADGTFAAPLMPRRRWYPPMKVALEWLAALLLFAPTATLIALMAAVVKLTSPGRALYSQRRVGHHGAIFTIYKIRTMVEDSEAATGAVWSQPGDPRVTKIGRFLRDTHLDELPQIWNVLRGDMSIIGPRPERPEMVAQLERRIPNYRDRLAIRPGLSGLAQVQLPPDSDDQSVKRKLAYDRYYVEHVSPWLDLRISVGTCLYLFSAALKAACNMLVRKYGHDIERAIAAAANAVIEDSQPMPEPQLVGAGS
jgi:lipopolysaccharide/colanic/teichoic acid biosynthesis glycosyltransferase